MDESASDATCILKVNINCCNACPEKLEKSLLKTKGVRLVKINREQNLVHVTGKLDVKKLFKTVAKIDRKVELVSCAMKPKDDKQMKVQETVENKDKGKKEKNGHNLSHSRHDSNYHQPEAHVAPETCTSRYLYHHDPSSYPPQPPIALPAPHPQFHGSYREEPPVYGDYYPTMQQQPAYNYENEYFSEESSSGCTIM